MDASLVDLEGNIVTRLGSGDTEQARIVKRQRSMLAREAQAAGQAVLSDITSENRAQTPMITMTVPVTPAGALILEIEPRTFLFPYLRGWPTTRRTGETILARLDGNTLTHLSDRRLGPGEPQTAQRLMGRPLPSPEDLARGVLLRGDDYRGQAVLAHVRSVPYSNWLLIAKIDEAEVRESINRLGWELTIILGLIGLAGGSGVGLIWKSYQLRVQHESEERFRSIANETPALLWMAGPDGGSLFINRRLGVFLGVDGEQPVMRWTDFVHPDDAARAKAEADASFEARTRFSYEMRMRRADGEYRWVLSEGAPRMGAGGFLGYAGALLDITERKAAEQQLETANAVLVEGLAEKTRREEEIRALSARLIHAQEEERRRLSRELHDGLSQQIAALSIAMGNLKRSIPTDQEQPRAQSDRIQQRLIELAETVRRMSHELHPAILQHSGLGPALRGFCREFGEVSGVQVELRVQGEFANARPDVALSVFRIVQEALQNVAKHARVNEAEVELIHTGESIRLTVSDRGVGFDPNGGTRSGLGLVSIRERTRLVQGSVELESAPGKGTRLTVRIPEEDGTVAASTA
jgi:PAS domain S-box-containing protein